MTRGVPPEPISSPAERTTKPTPLQASEGFTPEFRLHAIDANSAISLAVNFSSIRAPNWDTIRAAAWDAM